MSQNQDNPDNDYAKWQQEHDQRRRELYDDSDTNTYEYENNSSFTATPQKDYLVVSLFLVPSHNKTRNFLH